MSQKHTYRGRFNDRRESGVIWADSRDVAIARLIQNGIELEEIDGERMPASHVVTPEAEEAVAEEGGEQLGDARFPRVCTGHKVSTMSSYLRLDITNSTSPSPRLASNESGRRGLFGLSTICWQITSCPASNL